MRWKIKRFTNDALRQKFVDATVPQGHFLGLEFPDPALRFNAGTTHWDFGEIDWSEFRRVLAGDGPCNREINPRSSSTQGQNQCGPNRNTAIATLITSALMSDPRCPSILWAVVG